MANMPVSAHMVQFRFLTSNRKSEGEFLVEQARLAFALSTSEALNTPQVRQDPPSLRGACTKGALHDSLAFMRNKTHNSSGQLRNLPVVFDTSPLRLPRTPKQEPCHTAACSYPFYACSEHGHGPALYARHCLAAFETCPFPGQHSQSRLPTPGSCAPAQTP